MKKKKVKTRRVHKAKSSSRPKAKRVKASKKKRASARKKAKPLIIITKKAPTPRRERAVEERPLSSSEIQKFRDMLLEKQEELSEIVHRKKAEQEFQQEEPEIGDEADIATRSVEKELLFDIADSEKQTLDRVEAALRKIEKGVYGRCESCQKAIPRLRLEVMPWARYCIGCQSRNETPSVSVE